MARLAESFNEMADSIQRQISQLEEFGKLQRRFTSDVSHELRTPLTTVRMAAESCYDSSEDCSPALRRCTELLVTELDRFEALLGDLLEISPARRGRRRAGGRAGRHARRGRPRARGRAGLRRRGRHAAASCDLPDRGHRRGRPAPGRADPAQPDRQRRSTTARAKPVRDPAGRPTSDAVAVAVRDYGVGLRPGEAKLVFNRFWRADPSRVRRTGGTGLGLAISIEDARLHGGWLQAWGEPGKGAAFRLTLPRDRRRAAGGRARCRWCRTTGPRRRRRRRPAPPSSTSDAAAGSVPDPVARPARRPRRAPADRSASLPDREERPVTRRARCWCCCSSSPGSPGARACRRARRCRCCASVGTATSRCRRPARSTAATRSTSSAASSTPPGAARTGTAPPARSSPPRRRSGTTAPASPCSTTSSTPSIPPRWTPSRTRAPCASAAPRWAGSPRVAGSRPPRRRSRSTSNVVRRDGQWRIARLPGGVLVRMSDFRVNYRTVKTWFVDPVRRVAVPDLRYLPGSPARAQAARAMELLLAGPSTALQGAASSMFVTNAQLRSNVAASPDGALIVDLTQLGDLDEAGRRLLAAQVVLSLAEVSVGPGPAARRRRAAAAGPPRPDPGRRRVADRRTRSDDGARPGRLQRPGAPAQRGPTRHRAAGAGRQRRGRRAVGGVESGRETRGGGGHGRVPGGGC